jgi:hypothetical protein
MMNMEIPERPGLSGIFFCVQDVERGRCASIVPYGV